MDEPMSFFRNREAIESRRRKQKRIFIDERAIFYLNLHIHCAVGIDNPTLYPTVSRRHYFVRFWVKPDEGERFTTNTVEGRLDPCWNQKGMILLGNTCDDYDFLYVEVVREGPSVEPETSDCYTVVGRANVPLPMEVNAAKTESIGLVRFKDGEVKGEGFIVLSMELQKRTLSPRYLFG
ncbi:hypothetical protein L6164_028877 [Bauhinia variegata]|uniref:Uncharacterized protein n=1 Tax=Bauhinia variegata TaxID=167791 RepID=A0ACB9L6Z9_BAUVA|nr:hypothetical protein L6164_028877 [Bauhinia variegata]